MSTSGFCLKAEVQRVIDEGLPLAPVVYVLRRGSDGPLKIGRVTELGRLLKRWQELQLGCGEELHLCRLFELDAKENLEMVLHRRFAEHRLIGEWFAPAPEVLEFARGGE